MKTRYLLLFFVLTVTACTKMPNKQSDAFKTNESFKNSEFVYDNKYGIHYSFCFDEENKIHFYNRSWGLDLASVVVEYEAIYGDDVSSVMGNLVYMMVTKVQVDNEGIVEFVDIEDYITNYPEGNALSEVGALFYDELSDVLIQLYLPCLNEYMSKYIDSMSIVEYLNTSSDAEYFICKRHGEAVK